MSDADSDRAAQIELAAKRIASVVAAANVIGVLECGMQIVMVVYGLSAFLATTKARRKGRLPYILISFVILVLSAIPTFLNVWSEFNLIYNSGPGESYYNAIEGTETTWNVIVGYATMYSYQTLGDALLIYRSYIIWKDRPWVSILPCIMLLAVVSLWISGVVIISGLEVGDNLTQSLDGSAMLIHVCLNILVTLLIVVRLLRAHHTLSKVLPNRNLRVYRGAISIVIESALPFTICLFISGVVTIYRTVKDDAISWAAFATGFMSDTVARSLAVSFPNLGLFLAINMELIVCLRCCPALTRRSHPK
ncbi:hypothetical protein CC2G_002760 [Coprinopsis cinerea AmutBmut pab1-1]|nr:hypothetical protein CC2G_002760 [Coprinopsis cinerea AmutBmut pab1-1]